MASKGPRINVMLRSTGTNRKGKPTGYFKVVKKNTRNTPDKMEPIKFDPRAWDEEKSKLGKRVKFVEKKMPKSSAN